MDRNSKVEEAREYTYTEAAKKLRIKPNTLRHWVSAGRISYQKLGRLVRFTDEDLASAYRSVPMAPASAVRRRR
jgi:excisionase family DNA binding protein